MKHDTELDRLENQPAPITPTTNATTKKAVPIGAVAGISIATALVVGVGGFAAGMQFQKGTSASSLSQQGGPGGMNGFGPMNQNGVFGTITALSDSSITITTSNMGGPNTSTNSTSNTSTTGTTKTYTINSTTTISVDGSTAKVSDLQTGDTVMIQTDSTNSAVAASIRSGAGGMMGPGGNNNGTGTQQSTTNATTNTTKTN